MKRKLRMTLMVLILLAVGLSACGSDTEGGAEVAENDAEQVTEHVTAPEEEEVVLSDVEVALLRVDDSGLDLSRYLAFEEMIPAGATVDFYHLDRTFAFSLDAVETDILIYMQDENYFYVNLFDRYFVVLQRDVALVLNPDASAAADRVPVLMYHFFCHAPDEVECRDGNWLERDHFAAHMRHLAENDVTSLMMIDLERFLAGKVRLPEQSVLITIDDAHWSLFEYAYDVLVAYDQLATTFAITHHDRDWEALLLSEHLEFHSHTHDMHRGHCDEGRGGLMQCIDFDEGVADLLLSRDLLAGTTVFCYPFGDVNAHALAMLGEAGFTMAFTTQNGLVTRGMDPLLLPRVRVSTDTHLPQFIYLINQ
ncbi:MAG: polysaccharide deacetylase family protein [Turicibacter sp.]|nr:polysaccharide deacetylase family protein [Turicibacter sp.]